MPSATSAIIGLNKVESTETRLDMVKTTEDGSVKALSRILYHTDTFSHGQGTHSAVPK